MKKIGLIFTLAALFIYARAGFAQQTESSPAKAAATPKPGEVTFTGLVLDQVTGKPVPKISLYIIQQPAKSPEAKMGNDVASGSPTLRVAANTKVAVVKTDEAGKFEGKAPAGAKLQIMVITTNDSNPRNDRGIVNPFWFNSGTQEIFSGKIYRDKTNLVMGVKMWHGKPLAGKVLGWDGKPFKGATIYLHPQIPPVTSDEQGHFAINVPEDRDFELLALDTKAATPPANNSVTSGPVSGTLAPPKPPTLAGMARLKAGAAAATIRLEPTISVKGQALTPEGRPVNDLTCTVEPMVSNSSIIGLPLSFKTGADGSFTIDHVAAQGKFAIVWETGPANRDYKTGWQMVDLEKPWSKPPIKITTRKYVNALMGRVLDADDLPVPGARIKILSLDLVAADLTNSNFNSDKNGNFTIPRLAAGRVKIQAIYEGKSGVVESASDSVDCVIKLGKP